MTETSVNKNKSCRVRGVILGLAVAAISHHLNASAQQSPVYLGSAGRFAVLAGSEITSVPTDVISGDVGLSPSARSKITGLTAAEVDGTIFAADDNGATAAMLSQAKSDLSAAFINASPATRPGGIDVSQYGGSAGELGGRTLAPGLYQSAPGSYAVTSLNLTLDAGGNPNGVWIFQCATTLDIMPNRQVLLANGAQAHNVFWQVGTSATIYTYSLCQGVVMAAQTVALQTGATLDGSALAESGAVTLQANTITLQPQPPSFGPTALSGGSIVLSITNTPGVALNIEFAATLTNNWTILATPTPTNSPYIFNDNSPPRNGTRFYRAFYPSL